MQTKWNTLEAPSVVERLESDAARRLSQVDVSRRDAEYGPNEIVDLGRRGIWQILWEQFWSTMVLLLLARRRPELPVGG